MTSGSRRVLFSHPARLFPAMPTSTVVLMLVLAWPGKGLWGGNDVEKGGPGGFAALFTV